MLENSDIKIVGVGGAGLAVVSELASELPEGSKLAAIDTDRIALEACKASEKLLLSENGEGTGGDASAAKEAAAFRASELQTAAGGAKLLILVAGLGGGTGSVVAPLLSKMAEASRDTFILAFVFLPLSIEGSQREILALRARNYLSKRCAAVFALPNDIVLGRLDAPVADAFSAANENVVTAVSSVVKTLTSKGIVNIDFPTLKKIFSLPLNESFIAYGRGAGANCVDDALAEVMASPMLPKSTKAQHMIVSLRCGASFEMNRMQYLLESAAQKFGAPARLAFGAIVEPSFDDNIEICALGIGAEYADFSASPKKSRQASEHKQEETAQIAPEESSNEQEKSAKEPEAKAVETPSETPEPAQPETSAPTAEKVDVEPKPDEPEKPKEPAPQKKVRRRGFFGFGRKTEDEKPAKKASTEQSEFKFMELSQQRGFFEDTPPNIRNGVDLDVPTFMRKGIKINIQ